MPDPDVTPPVPHNFCGSCGTRLGAGARFCSACGAAVAGESAPGAAATPEARTPWLVAAALSVVAIAAVVYAAGRRTDAGPLDMSGGAGRAPAGQELGRAPDISNLSPRERFARLNDRVMAAAESGDTSTVISFWPMAYGAYEQLPPGDRDVDTRYHMATLYLLVGQFPQVTALADTIMTEAPGNLMAWYLRAVVAEFQNDSTALRTARQGFLERFDAEIGTGRDEYVHHADMLRDYRIVAGGQP